MDGSQKGGNQEYPLYSPLPHLVADYSRIDHTLEASSGTGTMTWGCLGLKGTSGNVETRISQGSSGIILGGGNRQTGSQ